MWSRVLGLAAAAAFVAPSQDPPAPGSASKPDVRALERAFREQKIRLDVERGLCSIPVTIDVKDDLLEYLLVNPHGAAHESLFVTEVVPSALNAALLALGVRPGKNARWVPKEPTPTAEEMRAGAPPFTVQAPEGDGFYLYAGWKQGGEVYFYRVDDLLRDLETGRGMRRHRWVYLGSRLVHTKKDDPKTSFAADLEGNLVNVALFEQGNTLLTAALPECLKQTIWLPNAWLIPERGAVVELVFSRARLAMPPPALEADLPTVTEDTDGGDGR